MSNAVIDLPGSTLAAIERHDDTIAVHFGPAIMLKSEGQAGVDPSTRWEQPCHLRFADAELSAEPPALPIGITGGRITINSMGYVDMLPVPIDNHGLVRLNLRLRDDTELVITAEAARLTLDGHGRYLRHDT